MILRIDDQKFNKLIADFAKPIRRLLLAFRNRRIISSTWPWQCTIILDSHNGRFPADIVDKDGKALLSWRVQLLPYLEQKQLYDQFKLDEPWDSEHNKKLVAKIPAIFVPPAQKSAAGTTTYLGPLGDGYLFRPKAKEGLKIADITDGTSNTIMIVEVADGSAVEWTKPGDWTPDAKEPAKALVGHYPEGFIAAFCDGSVRLLAKSIARKNCSRS